MSLKLIK